MAARRRHRPGALQSLLAASALTLVLYLVPQLQLLAWPLILVSTLVHELGHGLTALALGGDFVALYIWPDASGVAIYVADFGRLRHALVAAGGLLGPPFAATALFVAGRHPRAAHRALGASALVLLLVLALWARNPFGAGFILGLVIALGWLAWRGPARAAQVATVFLAVQLALSVFSRGDYLFMQTAATAQGPGPSDVGQIEQALLLPYWFWGALIAAASLALLWHGLRAFAAALR